MFILVYNYRNDQNNLYIMNEKIKKLSEVGHLILKSDEVLNDLKGATTTLTSEMHLKVLLIDRSNAREVLNYANCVVNAALSADCTFMLSYIHPMNVWIINPDRFEEVKELFK